MDENRKCSILLIVNHGVRGLPWPGGTLVPYYAINSHTGKDDRNSHGPDRQALMIFSRIIVINAVLTALITLTHLPGYYF